MPRMTVPSPDRAHPFLASAWISPNRILAKLPGEGCSELELQDVGSRVVLDLERLPALPWPVSMSISFDPSRESRAGRLRFLTNQLPSAFEADA